MPKAPLRHFYFLHLRGTAMEKKKKKNLLASYTKIRHDHTHWMCCYNHLYSCLEVWCHRLFSLPEAGTSDKESPGGLQQQTAYYSIRPLFCPVQWINWTTSTLTAFSPLSPCVSMYCSSDNLFFFIIGVTLDLFGYDFSSLRSHFERPEYIV